MDFLDPQKQKAHAIRLAIGYVVIALVLLLATVILLYQAYGYSIDRNLRVVQNGFVFVSSTPGGAEIFTNGQKKDNTNARLTLSAGQYVLELKRDGYRNWKRAVTVEGGTVQRFDYPFLFPTNLATNEVRTYQTMPGFITQSLDRRWLMVQSANPNVFEVFDLNRDELAPATYTIPAEILSAGTTTAGWEEIEWSKNNRHVLLRRLFDRAGAARAHEIILLDREQPELSRNLSVLLGFTPSQIELRNQEYDQYFLFDEPHGTLFTANLEKPTPQPYLHDVLAFESEGANLVVYATDKDAPAGKTLIRLREGNRDYTVRQVSSEAAPYLLDLARYEGNWFMAVGAAAENKIYLYKDPLDGLKKNPHEAIAPQHILKTPTPNYLDFAPENRFVVAQNGSDFSLYDVKTGKGYAYKLDMPVQDARGHATWMDGYHFNVLSGDKLVAFDYDGTNQQTLLAIGPSFPGYYDPEYRRLYTFSPTATLSVTELRIDRDR